MRTCPVHCVARRSAIRKAGAIGATVICPRVFKGTPLRAKGSPSLDLTPPAGMSERILATQKPPTSSPSCNAAPLRTASQACRPNSPRAWTTTNCFRMQMQVPKVLDLSQEDAKTKELYGIGQDATGFIRPQMPARPQARLRKRLVSCSSYNGSWDSMDYIDAAHGNPAGVQPSQAALITDPTTRPARQHRSSCVRRVWSQPDNGVRQALLRPGPQSTR